MPAKTGTGKGLSRRLLRRFAGWLRLADVLVFPSFCELCRAFLERPGETVICSECREKLRPCSGPFCPSCGRFFDGAGESHLCGDCLDAAPPCARHRSSARYQGALRDVLLLFKYGGNEILAKPLADLILRSAAGEEDLWDGVDSLVPVPLHPKRLKRRGYNQAAALARRLARLKGVPLLENALVKVRNNPAQTSLDAEDRRANVGGAYRVRQPGAVRGRVLLLVDDVYTTGATIGECSRVLKKAGAREVRAVTVARA